MTSRSRTSLISARTQTTLCSRTFASTLSKAKRLEVERGWVGSRNQKTAVSTSRPMVSTNRLKERVAKLLGEMIASDKTSDEYKALAQEWIANKEDAEKTKEIAPKLRACIAKSAAKGCPVCKELQTLDHYLVKRSQWIIGGVGSSTSEASKLESWHLWRFNPALIEEGKNPFSLDSKEPKWERSALPKQRTSTT